MTMTTSGARSAPSTAEETTIAVSGIGTEISDAMLMNMYRTYGRIVRLKHNGTNSAYDNKRHALDAVHATNGAVVHGKMLKVSLQRPFRKTTEPCRGFAAGICRKGDMCKYYHVTDDATFAPTAPPVIATKRLRAPKTPVSVRTFEVDEKPSAVLPEIQAISDKKVCRHFSRGFCSQGEACTFAHVIGLPKHDAYLSRSGKVARLCLFFQNGVCGRGTACRFVHASEAGAAPVKSSPLKAVTQSSSDNESETEPTQKNDDRTCAECEKPGIAVWECAQCEDSLYCDDCNLEVHRARVMTKHERKELPSSPKLPRCIECESATASVRCEQCESAFCVSCDTSVHKFKSLRKHVRVDLSSDGKTFNSKTKEPRHEHKAHEKNEKEKSEGAHTPRTKLVDTVPYVESVPQLQFSSDSESSEDEEINEPLAVQPGSSHLSAATTSLEAESDEDFDDVKLPASAPVTHSPAVESQAPQSSGSGNCKDKPTTKFRAQPTSAPKMESSSDSDSPDDVSSDLTRASTSSLEEAKSPVSEDDKAPSKSFAKLTRARKPALTEISSESESDSDDDTVSKPVVKRAKKSTPKTKSSSESFGGSEDSASTKLMGKKKKKQKQKGTTLASNLAEKKLRSASSSRSSSSDNEGSSIAAAIKLAPVPRRAPVVVTNNKAQGISDGSSHTLVKKIEAFNDSGEAGELHLNANLNGFERLLAHDCAERLGLAHESTGSGLERHIIISRQCAKRPAVDSGNRSKTKKAKHNRH